MYPFLLLVSRACSLLMLICVSKCYPSPLRIPRVTYIYYVPGRGRARRA